MTALLEGRLLTRIRESGPMPFAAYMQMCLYDPRDGYYASGETRTGRGGDFMTAPELDPAYGALWARAFHEIWESCGRPQRFHVVEVGPGEGTFAAALLDSVDGAFRDALHVDLVERVPAVADRQRAFLGDRGGRVDWFASVVDVPAREAGVAFANEVLDNLPVHLVEMTTGGLREVCVGASEGRLVFELLPPSSPELERFVRDCEVELPEGHRFEVHLAARSLVRRTVAMFARGASVFVDYGATAADLAARPGGTLVCYSKAGADDDPLSSPGGKDLTVHANWTALARDAGMEGAVVAGPRPQRDVLGRLGAGELDARLRTEHRDAVAAGRGATAVRAHSRRAALRALLDPGGMGGFGVTAALRAIPVPAFMRDAR